jgi:hypothetical protein
MSTFILPGRGGQSGGREGQPGGREGRPGAGQGRLAVTAHPGVGQGYPEDEIHKVSHVRE